MASKSGVVAYGAYVPYNRLERAHIGTALGSRAGKGTRAVASYDEDSTSLGVEAGRAALAGVADRKAVRQLFFATATPPYLDKTNATAIHAALALPDDALAVDMVGAARSGVGALAVGAQASVPTLAVLADVRTGLPGSTDEAQGGDGAAAFVLAPEGGDLPVLATVVAHAAATDEFLDRWRVPGSPSSRQWEERFGEEAYVPLAETAVTDALKQAGITPEQVDHLVATGLHARAVKRAAAAVGVRPEAVARDLSDTVGNTGTAHAGLLLADVLDRAGADETILLLVLADGADAIVLRTTAALAKARQQRSVESQIAAGSAKLDYSTFLTWRGFLDRDPPRRPDPAPPYAPPAHRRTGWKFAFVAGKCTECGTRSLPPQRVCIKCRAIDAQAPEPLADVPGKLATYTIDRLAFTPGPPLIMVVVDYDGGGRLRCELTDARPEEAVIGLPVEMTFRRTVTAGSIHNYFWKARPIRSAAGE